MLSSYASIYNLGHRCVQDLLTHEVNLEEKIDGSQISFGVTFEGELLIRSKGVKIEPEAAGMFSLVVPELQTRQSRMVPGWTYRGEYLRSSAHNTLKYNRVPKGHVILFDIDTGLESYCHYEDKLELALDLDLEVVPLLFSGRITDIETIQNLLTRESCLGGPKIEGVVIKPKHYDVFGVDKKLLLAKFVSPEFKEVHRKVWGEANPSKNDVVALLAAQYRTPARWQKAVQHLAERGELLHAPQDIGKLMKEASLDLLKEESENIKEALFNWAWKIIGREAVKGLPEWYKAKLESQLDSRILAKEELSDATSNQ